MFKLKPVKPDLGGLNPKRYERAIKTAVGIVAVTALQEFQQTTRTWRRKPDFKIRERSDGAYVGTDDEIYKYVDEGTRPHLIRARRAKALRFGAGSQPKTTPGSLKSGGGSPGSPTLRRAVRHPGTKARGFSKLIAERAERRMPDEVARELKKVTG